MYSLVISKYRIADMSSLCSSDNITAIVFSTTFAFFILLGYIAVYYFTAYEYDRTQQVKEKYEEIQRIIKAHNIDESKGRKN